MSENILLFCVEDFANCTQEFVEALRAVGVNARGFTLASHGFNYTNQLPIPEQDGELFGAVRSASKILYLQSTKPPRDAIPRDRRFKKLYLFVGDQGYRNRSNEILSYYPKLEKVFYQGSDLKGKSPYKEEWLLPAIDTDFIQTKQDVSLMAHKCPIRIAHFPRDPKAKGSEVILKVMAKMAQDEELKDSFIFDYQDKWRCDWEENLARLDSCDVYIESQAYMLGDKKCSEFGVTAMEACSLSKIVVTCFSSFEDYKREFGVDSEIAAANCEEELEQALRIIIQTAEYKPREFVEKRLRTRWWVENYHGRIPTGLRLKKMMDIGV